MPNHVHLILVPATEDGLRRCLCVVHRAYAGTLHARFGRTGHFWQGRYGSVAMDEAHLYEALRYVLLNPVRARLAVTADAWRRRAISCAGSSGTAAGGCDRGVVDRPRVHLRPR